MMRPANLLLCAALLAPASAWAQAADGASDDQGRDTITVTGLRPITQARAGTKTDTPLVETPQSVSVITAADISDLGLQNLGQSLRFVSGITPEQRGADAEVYDLFKLRGFDALRYLDGLRVFNSATGYADAQVDVSRIDRIEVVKGPSSALYGQSGPGGLVAMDSKLPIPRAFYGAVSGSYGNYDLYRIDADIGGQAGAVLWRLYGSANGAHEERRFGKRERETISPAVTVGSGTSTTFTLLGNYSHDPYNGDYGVEPAVGTLIANPNGKLPTRFDGGEPDNRFRREQASLTYILTHDFGGGWSFRSSGRYQYVHTRLGIVYVQGDPDPADATLRTYPRASYSTREQLNNWTYDNQLTGKIQTGPVTHNLLFGTDRQVGHTDEVYAFGSATPLDIYAPVYGTMVVPQEPEDVPDAFGGSYLVHEREQGVYAQDQMSLGDLRLTLSGRQDWARTLYVGSAAQHDSKFTWRVGSLYKTSFGLAPYVSYSTSFQPQLGQVLHDDGSVGNASPTVGKQLEAGAKYQVPGTPILLTAAWFRINQTNLLTAIPNSPYSTETGRVRSKGVEVEANAPLPGGFNARLAFSRQHVRGDDGLPLVVVGKGGTSFNLDWTPKSGPLEGVTLGGAVRRVDSVYAGVASYDGVARSTPAYTLFDALFRYDLAKASPRLAGLEVGVNAANVFDKKYLTTCYSNYGWCWYGNRRTVQGTIGYRW